MQTKPNILSPVAHSTRRKSTNEDLVELISKEVPGCTVEYVKKNEDPRDYRVSFERIRAELGFHVTRRVPDGIRELSAALRGGLFEDVESPRLYNSPP